MRNVKHIGAIFLLAAILAACSQPEQTLKEPTIWLSASLWDPGIGEAVDFEAHVNAHDLPYTLNWDLGDGTTIIDGPISLQHTYRSSGDYTAEVSVIVGASTKMASRLITVQATPSLRSWRYTERKDPITDADTSYIRAGSSSLYLYIRCSASSDGVDVYVTQDRHLGIQNSYPVTYRVDSRDAITARWDASANYQAAFARTANVPALFQELAAGSEATFRIGAFDGDRTYRAISIEGFRPALDKLGCYTGPAATGNH